MTQKPTGNPKNDGPPIPGRAALLEQQFRDIKRSLPAMKKKGSFVALGQARKQLLEVHKELDALRASEQAAAAKAEEEEEELTDAELEAALVADLSELPHDLIARIFDQVSPGLRLVSQ